LVAKLAALMVGMKVAAMAVSTADQWVALRAVSLVALMVASLVGRWAGVTVEL
jgi:putative Mn2+ efflux pump MntP